MMRNYWRGIRKRKQRRGQGRKSEGPGQPRPNRIHTALDLFLKAFTNPTVADVRPLLNMSITLLSDLKKREAERHNARMGFLSDCESFVIQAETLGFRVTIEPIGTPEIGPEIQTGRQQSPVTPARGEQSGQLRTVDDKMGFSTVNDAVDYAVIHVAETFTSVDIFNAIRDVAPGYFSSKDLSSFSHSLKRLDKLGRIRQISRGAGKKPSIYRKLQPQPPIAAPVEPPIEEI